MELKDTEGNDIKAVLQNEGHIGRDTPTNNLSTSLSSSSSNSALSSLTSSSSTDSFVSVTTVTSSTSSSHISTVPTPDSPRYVMGGFDERIVCTSKKNLGNCLVRFLEEINYLICKG